MAAFRPFYVLLPSFRPLFGDIFLVLATFRLSSSIFASRNISERSDLLPFSRLGIQYEFSVTSL